MEFNKQHVIDELKSYKARLRTDVLTAYESRGSVFGSERFETWKRRIGNFLEQNLPGECTRLNSKLTIYAMVITSGESDAHRFWREQGNLADSYIDSLILDIENGDYEQISQERKEKSKGAKSTAKNKPTRVFIVHGHDNLAKVQTARFIEALGFEAIILHEQTNRGKTIIDKIEACTNVDFAIVLYTPDDQGNNKDSALRGELKNRARQNVIFEHGYLIAKLGRDCVVPLVSGDVELPSDIQGIVYVTDTDWQISIAKEMLAVGFDVDFNKLLKAR